MKRARRLLTMWQQLSKFYGIGPETNSTATYGTRTYRFPLTLLMTILSARLLFPDFLRCLNRQSMPFRGRRFVNTGATHGNAITSRLDTYICISFELKSVLSELS